MEKLDKIFSKNSFKNIGHFEYLFIALIFAVGIKPFLKGIVGINILTNLLYSFIYFTAIFTVIESKKLFRLTLILAAPLLLVSWISYFVPKRHLIIIDDILAILFYTYTITILLTYLLRQKRVTRDVIMCAMSTYLLIGILWASMYIVLESFVPGSFNLTGELERRGSEFVYYSFITLTTLGYGDISPVTDQARALAVIETILGQMYVAIMIARLVGIQISQSFSADSDKK